MGSEREARMVFIGDRRAEFPSGWFSLLAFEHRSAGATFEVDIAT
jgi:hypothetical protein